MLISAKKYVIMNQKVCAVKKEKENNAKTNLEEENSSGFLFYKEMAETLKIQAIKVIKQKFYRKLTEDWQNCLFAVPLCPATDD